MSGVAEIGPLLEGLVFSPLRDPASFARVKCDSISGTVVWPNGADFAPEASYERITADSTA